MDAQSCSQFGLRAKVALPQDCTKLYSDCLDYCSTPTSTLRSYFPSLTATTSASNYQIDSGISLAKVGNAGTQAGKNNELSES
jgi:hypothetical protein